MSKIKCILCAALIIIVSGKFAYPDDSLQRSIQNEVKEARCKPDRVGVCFADATTGEILATFNPDAQFNPASVSKLVTGAVAFETFGLPYSFTTHLYTNGTFDKKTGAITGDLYIRGGGDPGLTTERVWLLTGHLASIGLKSISGNIICDDFLFDSITTGPHFGEGESSRAYDSEVGALSASFNSIEIFQSPGDSVGSPTVVTVFPSLKNIVVENKSLTIAANRSGTIDLQTRQSASTIILTARGGRSISDPVKVSYRKAWQTWENFGYVFAMACAQQGIGFSGGIRHEKTPDTVLKRVPIYSFASQPLSSYVADMFKYSTNFVAEMLYKSLSLANDPTAPASWAGGSALVSKWWKTNNLPGTCTFTNGSGMGDANRISASQVVALLNHVWRVRTYTPEYLGALPIAGVDGTLKSRFKNPRLRGIVRAKTGMLNDCGAYSLAGYILLPSRTISFAILAHGAGPAYTTLWKMQEEMCLQAIKQ